MHLPIIGSGHASIFLNVYPSSNNCNYKIFKFEAKLLHDDFLNNLNMCGLYLLKLPGLSIKSNDLFTPKSY